MTITNSAKEIIDAALKQEHADGIRLHTERSCCGTSLQFELVSISAEDQPETINGLSVLMDDETRIWTGTVTIDAKNGRLTLHDSASSCCR